MICGGGRSLGNIARVRRLFAPYRALSTKKGDTNRMQYKNNARKHRNRGHKQVKRKITPLSSKKRGVPPPPPIISEFLTQKLESIQEATRKASRRFQHVKKHKGKEGKRKGFQRKHGFIVSKGERASQDKSNGSSEQDPVDVVNRNIQFESNAFKHENKKSASRALEVYKNAFGGDLSPNIKTINLMLNALHNSADIRDSSRAMYFWGEMQKYDLQPNSTTYSDMIKNLTKLGMVASAFDFYRECQSKGLPSAPNDPHVLLRACAKVGDFHRADKFINEHLENWKGGSNFAISNMVNSLLELSEGAAAHRDIDRLTSYNKQLVEMSLQCPEDSIVKWRPILNACMKGIIMSINHNHVAAAKTMLAQIKKIPPDSLQYNGLFSVIFRQQTAASETDDMVVSDAPPLLRLERGIVSALLFLAARNGCGTLADDVLELTKEYAYELSPTEARALFRAHLPVRDAFTEPENFSMRSLERLVLKMKSVSNRTFDAHDIDDLARSFSSSIYAIDSAFYELQEMRQDRSAKDSVDPPAELACAVMRGSLVLQDSNRVLETLRDWESICGEPVSPHAICYALESTVAIEKDLAEDTKSGGVNREALEDARDRMNDVVHLTMDIANGHGVERCDVVSSALVQAHARIATIESIGNLSPETGVEAIADILGEMQESGVGLTRPAMEMVRERATHYGWGGLSDSSDALTFGAIDFDTASDTFDGGALG